MTRSTDFADGGFEQEPTLSQEETIAFLLDRSKRKTRAVPIRRTFLQQGPQGKPRPGPLAPLVRLGADRALDLFLVVHAVASAPPHQVTEYSNHWGRVIGIEDEANARTAVSRAWRRLESMKLIARERGKLGRTKVTLLEEDGSGEPYETPKTDYFRLPYEYWTGEQQLYKTLSLPAKAVLLVSLSFTASEFPLPHDRAAGWYGISADTIGRGLKRLQDVGVVEHTRTQLIKNLKSKTGYMPRHLYSLRAPFDLKRRGMGRRAQALAEGAVYE
jgi:hypothetical protein